MDKIDEYLKHAGECCEMARIALPAHRVQLEEMAAIWEQLAEARSRQLARSGRVDSTTASAAEPGPGLPSPGLPDPGLPDRTA
jgi:hypothetical protein